MANVFDYIKKYGDKTFSQKRFNEIDNLIFSELAYCDLRDTKVDDGRHTIGEIGAEYTQTHHYADVKKLGIAMADAYKMLEVVMAAPRYKDLRITDYDYNVNSDMQFGAMTFEILPDLIYVAFEGTDQLISGWKEDVDLACFFPVPSHVQAVEYLNRNIKTFGPDVIVGGHSKGGNLALVSAMFMSRWKKRKILRVYSNDGPGLRKREFESARYRSIKSKYVHIVPETSFFGVMLRHDSYRVIKSSKMAPVSHAISTWQIEDSKLVRGALSPKSAAIEKSIIRWLDTHSDAQRKRIGMAIFGTMQKAGVLETIQLKNPRNILRVVSRFNKDVDEESKKLVKDLIMSCYGEVKKA